MWKALLFAASVSSVLLVAATSRSDDLTTTEQPPPTLDLSEPATVPLGPNPPRDPFAPYDPGPSSTVWQYEDLSQADQAAVDREEQDATSWRSIHDTYGAALAQRSAQASAEIAQHRLGLLNVGEIGVVP